ncbi:MAG TPA: Gfo/Idh/MocA family oxidoreductase [Steroidobacteraceae bacterium]|nr:Gfo/Idh/MocA family oxidoreductase [Steroidobacteraceae bacterium]
MTAPIAIAIAGLGKIARDQHLPSLAASTAFNLVATASPHDALEQVPGYPDIARLLDARPDLEAVAVCTTPQARFEVARQALRHGCHVLLEKPPAATLGEARELIDLAAAGGVTLLASWHSRHANGVEPAREWLSARRVRRVSVRWKEDVRKWHPGQAWIWKAGGLGVFDPGINALSILTRILPGNLVLHEAQLAFPSNCACPIAATLELADASGAPIHMELDFRQAGAETWDIDVETDGGELRLSKGASVLHIDGRPIEVPRATEYSRLYAHFAALVRARRSDADITPLALVADAFLAGRRIEVEAFHD